MNEWNLFIKIIDYIFDRIPCFLWGHIYTRKLKSWEAIYLNGNWPLVEYTCTKCGKKTKLSQ